MGATKNTQMHMQSVRDSNNQISQNTSLKKSFEKLEQQQQSFMPKIKIKMMLAHDDTYE